MFTHFYLCNNNFNIYAIALVSRDRQDLYLMLMISIKFLSERIERIFKDALHAFYLSTNL